MSRYEYIDSCRTDPTELNPVTKMCAWLLVSTSGFYHWLSRPQSATAARRQALTARVEAFFKASDGTYGYRRIHADLVEEGDECSPELVRQIMRTEGLIACQPRPFRVTTEADAEAAAGMPDLVRRDFTATAPNQLWVTDLTFVPTWAGVAYVCFIIDACSRAIVGWRVASHMRTTTVLDAIEMARWSRGTQLTGLRCHSDAGSQFTSIRYGERLAEIGAVPSIGTVGDSFDNALAETVNGYYKAELIRGPAREGRPWKTVEDVELATLSWVHWHNHERLHGYLDDVPPAEFEETFYATKRTAQTLVGIQ